MFDKKLCLDDIEPELLNKSLNSCSILTGPLIVDRWYWKKGYFLNVSHMDCFIKENDYGYYRNGNHIFCDDYGHEISYIPKKLATYGVQTRYGVSYNIRKKLIMNRIHVWSGYPAYGGIYHCRYRISAIWREILCHRPCRCGNTGSTRRDGHGNRELPAGRSYKP